MAGKVSAGRWAAFRILLRVEKKGGFAADLLHSPLTAGLEERDLGLAEELTLGVLRWQAELDRRIAEEAGRPAEKLDTEVRLALRLGAYQLQCLDRIPEHAAVSESVEIVKRARKNSAAGLVNAVLRKVASRAPPCRPTAESAVPKWMLERWRRYFGEARADEIALATLQAPPAYVRLNAQCDPEETVRLLAAEGVETAPTELPFCRLVRSGRPARTECFRQGRLRIQDLGSQRVTPLLSLEAGHRFLDLCAAPGGKTFQALEQRGRGEPGGRQGLAVACDLSFERLLTMRRLATMPVALVALDATRPLPFATQFDRILVDAPCSGTGTLAHNPEIKWRLAPRDIEDLAARQRAILARALDALAPGGRLVYATCSLEPEENEGVVDAVLGPGFGKGQTYQWLPGAPTPAPAADGFFACVIART
ncbi:MAG TPA: transcription antitermination factor NusB [Bryobacterales bacterium]|nr:transcription antitermination factor NusB [Bryobacterales bacterium]